MARYVKDLVLNKPEDFVTFIMNDYLQKNQFVVSEWKGEPAYRTGDALIEGYKYLKWSYENGTLHLEAWMKSTFGKEMGLDGFVGALQKKPYREGLAQLFHVLEQAIPEAGMNEMTGQQGMNGANGQPKPHPVPVKTVDIGIPLLAMHSARELMGSADQQALKDLVTAYFTLAS